MGSPMSRKRIGTLRPAPRQARPSSFPSIEVDPPMLISKNLKITETCMKRFRIEIGRRAALAAIVAMMGAALQAGLAYAADPIKIGFSLQLTGPLAASAKAALLAAQIWAEEVNKAGGLLGREVQLVYYDDQSNPGLVPG